jgi:hypothetical protein
MKEVPMIRLFDRTLRLPATSRRGSSILEEVIRHANRLLTLQQATGNVLAPGFKTVLYGIAVTVFWLLTTVNYLLSASH